MNRGEVGRLGEKLARNHLKKQGCRVIELNHRSRLGELDIICRDSSTIVFVEVKTRTSDAFGSPAEAVDARKQAKLRRLAQEYLIGHGLEASDVRFDVLGIRLDADPPEIDHIRDAF